MQEQSQINVRMRVIERIFKKHNVQPGQTWKLEDWEQQDQKDWLEFVDNQEHRDRIAAARKQLAEGKYTVLA